MNYKLSIIIPVFNAANYLERCIDSLLQQTLDDIELIFINDASTDQSLSILQRYSSQSQQRCIKIINLEKNGGISNARNIGLDTATGEYITHCDSDDWIDAEAYEILYDTAISQQADIVSCNFIHEYADHSTTCRQPYTSDNKEMIKRLLSGQVFPSLWVSIIKRNIITDNNLHFPTGLNMGEDLLFNVKSYYYSNKIASVEKAFYHYRHSNNSVCIRRTRQSIDSDILIAKHLEQFLEEKGLLKYYEKEILYRKFFSKLALYTNNKDKSYDEWIQIYPETNRHIWDFKQLSWTLRLELWLVANGMRPLASIFKKILKFQHKIRL